MAVYSLSHGLDDCDPPSTYRLPIATTDLCVTFHEIKRSHET